MLKKALVGAFLLVMVGAVIAGGIALFTNSETAFARGETGQQGQGVAARGRSNEQDVAGGWGNGGGRQGGALRDESAETAPGGGYGRSQDQGSGAQAGGGYGGTQGQGSGAQAEGGSGGTQGQGNGARGGGGSGSGTEVVVDDLETVEGIVVETVELVIETNAGETVQVGLGPSHYRESHGFVLSTGDSVRVTGFWEEDEFKALEVKNLSTGDQIVLRNASGRPMWAGRGA